MTTVVEIISTLFFLVPGFLIGRIHQATREFRELSAFEYTTISVAQGFVVFAVWAVWVLVIGALFPFHLVDHLKEVILSGKADSFFTNALAVFAVTYLTSFGLVAIFMFNVSWTWGVNRGLRALGLNRFNEHLTPWEDFQVASQLHWIIVELKDGRKIMGKMAFGSHLPYTKELVLTAVNTSPIRIFDGANRPVDYGRSLELTYISADDIQDMHMVRDEEAEKAGTADARAPRKKVRWAVETVASLLLTASLFAFFMMLFALSLDGSPRSLPTWIQFFSPLTLLPLLWNMKALGKFS